MAKIIIIAPIDLDLEDALEKLSKHEIIRVAPSPANFLHMCLGMLPDDPNDGVTDAEDELEDEESDVEQTTDAEDPVSESTSEVILEPVNLNPESTLGKVVGEDVNIIVTDDEQTVLKTSVNFENGKFSYKLNETEVKFWTVESTPLDNIKVELNNVEAYVNVRVESSEDGSTTLYLGKDNKDKFQT